MLKLLLYCTRSKPYLFKTPQCAEEVCKYYLYPNNKYLENKSLNGKVVGECDFEVERIIYRETDKNNYSFGTETLTPDELLERSCLTTLELCKYIGSNPNWTKGDYGYAIHIKNLTIFDAPKELSDYLQSRLPNPKHIKFANWEANYYWALGDYTTKNSQMTCKQLVETFNNSISIKKAPQNMCYCYDTNKNMNILISIRPEWLYQILNGKKTIECRKRILKGMITK